jgi:hypothetical protein
LLLYFCTQKNERQTHSCHYQPPFPNKLSIFLSRLRTRFLDVSNLSICFFFIFHLDCEGVSDGGTHAHPLTRISDREKKTYKEREKNAAAVSQYSGIYPAACLFSSSLFCFSLCCAFCFITAYRTEDGPTPLSPPSLLPYKDTCGTRGGGRERKRERETSEPRGVGRRDNP